MGLAKIKECFRKAFYYFFDSITEFNEKKEVDPGCFLSK
jgi:hypothetical protein